MRCNLGNIKWLMSLCLSLIIYGVCNAQETTIDSLYKHRNYKKIIELLTVKQSDSVLTFKEYQLLSRSYGRTRQFGNGYVLSEEMLEKAMKLKDTLNILKAFNAKAEHITDLLRIKEGVSFCDSITPFFRRKDSLEFMKLCFKCGMLYYYDHQYPKAYDSYKAITKKEYQVLSIYKNNLALILKGLNDYDASLSYFKQGLIARKQRKIVMDPELNVEYSNIGLVYLNKGDLSQAKKYLDSAYHFFNSNSRLSSKKTLFDNYLTLYQLQANEKKVIAYLDSIKTLNEFILKDRIEERILTLESAYKKEEKLSGVVIERDKKLWIAKNQLLQGTLYLLGFVFLLIIIVFLFFYLNLRSTYKNTLLEQQLSWVQLKPDYLDESLFNLKNMVNERNPKSIRYLSKYSKFLRLVLDTSRNSLIPLTDEVKTLTYFLDLHQLEGKYELVYSIDVDQSIEEFDIDIPPMLIQPILEEILKEYDISQMIDLKLKFTYQSKCLKCVIAYNNDEIKETTIKKVKSVMLLFSKQLKISSGIESNSVEVGKGIETRIILTLPYKLDFYD